MEASQLAETLRLLQTQGKSQEAITALRKALQEPQFSPDWTLLHLGVKLCNRASASNDKSRPLNLLKQAQHWLSIWPTSDPLSQSKKSKWTITTLLRLSCVFSGRRKYHKSLNALMKALKLAKATDGRLKAEVLIAIAAFYAELRSFCETEMYARQALTVLQQTIKSDQHKVDMAKISPLYVQAFALIGKAEERLGNRKQSLSAYKKGLEIATKHLKSDTEKTEKGRNSSRQIFASSIQSGISRSISSSPQRSMVLRTPSAPRDRYYSAEKLSTLHQQLHRGTQVPFLSTDQYYSVTITRNMNLQQDVPHLRPLSVTAARFAWERDEEDRRRVSVLRLRRHAVRRKSCEGRGRENVLSQIRKLEEAATVLANTTKTPINRRERKPSAAQIALQTDSTYPPQRLLFRPPGTQLEEQRGVRKSPSLPSRSTPGPKDNTEALITRLEKELSVSPKKRQRSRRRKSKQEKELEAACELARSAQTLLICTPQRKTASKQEAAHVEALANRMRRRTTIACKPTASVSFET